MSDQSAALMASGNEAPSPDQPPYVPVPPHVTEKMEEYARAGQGGLAYRHLREYLETQNIPNYITQLNWLQVAEDVNSNYPGFMNNFVRSQTALQLARRGEIITPEKFQNSSNEMLLHIIKDINSKGGITYWFYKKDMFMFWNTFGAPPHRWPGISSRFMNIFTSYPGDFFKWLGFEQFGADVRNLDLLDIDMEESISEEAITNLFIQFTGKNPKNINKNSVEWKKFQDVFEKHKLSRWYDSAYGSPISALLASEAILQDKESWEKVYLEKIIRPGVPANFYFSNTLSEAKLSQNNNKNGRKFLMNEFYSSISQLDIFNKIFEPGVHVYKFHNSDGSEYYNLVSDKTSSIMLNGEKIPLLSITEALKLGGIPVAGQYAHDFTKPFADVMGRPKNRDFFAFNVLHRNRNLPDSHDRARLTGPEAQAEYQSLKVGLEALELYEEAEYIDYTLFEHDRATALTGLTRAIAFDRGWILRSRRTIQRVCVFV